MDTCTRLSEIHCVVYMEIVRFWINVCDWFAGKSYSFVMDWMAANLLNHTDIQLNVFHTCPFSGHLYLKSDNISVEVFSTFPMLSAADYRVHFDLYTSDRKTFLAGLILSFSVSDHRVETI